MALKFTASFSLSLFTVFVIVEAGRRQRTFTFDLLKYSNVETYSTYDNTKENEDFLRAHRCRKTRDNGLQCHNPSEANLKNTLRTNELTWLADFRDGVREVEIAVNFPYSYMVQTVLLTLKEAHSISALSIDVYDANGNYIQERRTYGASKLLCEFFFPTYEENESHAHVVPCQADNELSKGVIFFLPHPLRSRKVSIKFYPPISQTQNDLHEPSYKVSELFIGGRCSCLSSRPSDCIAIKEDNPYTNNGYQDALVCIIDQERLRYEANLRRSKRKRRFRRNAEVETEEESCLCSKEGTLYNICNPLSTLGYQCPCKVNFIGSFCNTCAQGYYDFPSCKSCACNVIGSKGSLCDANGQCKCGEKYTGRACDQCKAGHYDFPLCHKCRCPVDRSKSSLCDSLTGDCHCLSKFTGAQCDQCSPGLLNFPICHPAGEQSDNSVESIMSVR